MDPAGFAGLFQALTREQLTDQQVASVEAWLAALSSRGHCLGIVEQAAGACPCPHCGCARRHRCGQANGLQRYRCMACTRSDNALTGTPLARLRHRDKWLPYLQCLLDSRTVRDAARRVDVARSTSFRLRHRFIASVRRERPAPLAGMVDWDCPRCCFATSSAVKPAAKKRPPEGGLAESGAGTPPVMQTCELQSAA